MSHSFLFVLFVTASIQKPFMVSTTSTTMSLSKSTNVLMDTSKIISTEYSTIPLVKSTTSLDISTTIPIADLSTKIIPSPMVVSTTKTVQDILSTTIPVSDMSPVGSSNAFGSTISVTSSTPPGLVTIGQCNPGFVRCTDGRCEPFELLCEDGVAVTLPTRPTDSPRSTAGTTTPVLLMSTSRSLPYVSPGPGIAEIRTTGGVDTIPPQTNGQCHVGFIQCTDGRCEPFEQLCGDAGFVTLPTRKPEMTTSTSMPFVTNSEGTIITSPTGPPPSTLPTTIVTLPPLDNGCAPGFELCQDKICEPFHFMCEEHLSGELVGR